MKDRGDQIIIYQTEDGKASVYLYPKDGSVWMSQKELAKLFATSIPNVSIHVRNIFEDSELDKNSVVKEYLTTGPDGKNYTVQFYNLEMVLAIGFRVRSKRGIQFRKWANRHLREFIIKGFVMDDDRLKNPDGRPDYFDELLARIRDIRASEKRFYQKVRELFSLSTDYDSTDKATQMFFAETQNKLLYAITGKTAAEIVVSRASANEPNMALTSWKGKVVRKQDIFTAKNYLTKDELDSLNRFVVVFLETAELRAKDRKEIAMSFWKENVDRIIQFNDKKILTDRGKVSKAQMEEFALKVYQEFNARRKVLEAQDADQGDIKELLDGHGNLGLDEIENLSDRIKRKGS